MKYWNSLGKKKQNQILIVFTFMVLGAYLLGWHWQNYTKLKHSENMVSRAENRLKLKVDSIPEPPLTAGQLDKEFVEQKEKKRELEFEFNQINSIFMPLDDIQAYQNLRLSISDLAEKNGVDIESVNEINRGGSLGGSDGEQSKFTISEKWGRPLIEYRMNLRYIDFLNYIEGLEKLEYQVSVVKIEIEADLADEDAVADVANEQFLSVQLVMAL